MTNDKQENRIKIDDLPPAEQELTSEEAKEVKGGLVGFTGQEGTSRVRVATGDVTGDGTNDIVTGAGPSGHIK